MDVPQRDMNFAELMQAGRDAINRRNRAEAHTLLKKAAALDPYSEQVWLALLEVIDNDEDRRVCLQNILQINPLNIQARRSLNKIEAEVQRAELQKEEEKASRQVRGRRRRSVVARALLLGLGIGLSGALFAIVISIILYGPR